MTFSRGKFLVSGHHSGTNMNFLAARRGRKSEFKAIIEEMKRPKATGDEGPPSESHPPEEANARADVTSSTAEAGEADKKRAATEGAQQRPKSVRSVGVKDTKNRKRKKGDSTQADDEDHDSPTKKAKTGTVAAAKVVGGWSNAARVKKPSAPKKKSNEVGGAAPKQTKGKLVGPQVSQNYVRLKLGTKFNKGSKKFGRVGW